jgi:small subunit ribosomal protein S1
VTKVVTFGAFVEILPGVEGLVHISELAAHHVENPREVVSQGDTVRVKIIEVDAERRRLSLSLKRVEEGAPVRTPDGAPPQLDLSEDVFGDDAQPVAEDAIAPHGEADAEGNEEFEQSEAGPGEDAPLASAVPGELVAEEPASPAADEGPAVAAFTDEAPGEEPAETQPDDEQ